MSVGSILAELREKQIRIWAEGDRLRCQAPPGVMTPELKASLADHKTELLTFLNSGQALVEHEQGIVPLQGTGDAIPIFAVPGHNGDVFCYLALSRHLGKEYPFFGLQLPGLYGNEKALASVEDLALYFLQQIRAVTTGPVIIAGYCAGGAVAFELARQLQNANIRVLLLALFGSPYPTFFRPHNRLIQNVRQSYERNITNADGLLTATRRVYLLTTRKLAQVSRSQPDNQGKDDVLARRAIVGQATVSAIAHYRPGTFAGQTAVFLPSKRWAEDRYFARSWRRNVASYQEYIGPDGCDGDNMLLEPHVMVFSGMFARAMEAVSSAETSAQVRS
jgi:thioesterase domain-containing protein